MYIIYNSNKTSNVHFILYNVSTLGKVIPREEIIVDKNIAELKIANLLKSDSQSLLPQFAIFFLP